MTTFGYAARAGYQRIDASRYERRRYGSPARRLNHRLLEHALTRALASVPPGALILDGPCGSGILTPLLHRLGLRTLGLDLSPAMLDVARGRRPATGLLRGDLEHVPLRDDSVDGVVSTRFMMHLPPAVRIEVLRALARLTGGAIVFTVCHPYTLKRMSRTLRRGFGRPVKQGARLTMDELELEVGAAGLRIERVRAVCPLLSEVWVVVARRVDRVRPERTTVDHADGS